MLYLFSRAPRAPCHAEDSFFTPLMTVLHDKDIYYVLRLLHFFQTNHFSHIGIHHSQWWGDLIKDEFDQDGKQKCIAKHHVIVTVGVCELHLLMTKPKEREAMNQCGGSCKMIVGLFLILKIHCTCPGPIGCERCQMVTKSCVGILHALIWMMWFKHKMASKGKLFLILRLKLRR